MTAATNIAQLQAQINTQYATLSKRLQQVASYVLENNQSLAFDTIATIATQANVPPSTLIRFAKAFEFSGFNEIKKLFRQDLIEETTSYTDRARLYKENNTTSLEKPLPILQEFARVNSEAMHQLATQASEQQLTLAVNILSNAENIYILGLRRSYSTAAYLTYALRHVGRKTFLLDGLGGMFDEQASMIGTNDVLLSISFSPYAKETQVLTESVSQKGAKQIIITDSKMSPLAAWSDVCFVVNEGKVDAFRSQSASLCLVQSLVVALAFQ
ncbi:Fe-S cluster assembly protein HesB [Psychromonas sp. B3M02]|uniref:MurR/RpiR family transcriptional regulator n=1 Tax=Psychromonas sp. B3M02 TaxID=2267226 RepID=UPI000DEA276E|nr:MurR/RpiR family transcriptional regulator [Psychromonas sp. B3M02]RBW46908.1 Fe-S cluster assembly protein HesB [Psychromonas sp. B3M02]